MIDLKTNRSQLAFTFVELVITATILGVLSSIALVNLSSSWKNNRLLSSTRELENWLSKQRSYAMAHGLTCRIVINEDTKHLLAELISITATLHALLIPQIRMRPPLIFLKALATAMKRSVLASIHHLRQAIQPGLSAYNIRDSVKTINSAHSVNSNLETSMMVFLNLNSSMRILINNAVSEYFHQLE